MVIQRSWKILSDAGSTSASSTEANRSPSNFQSSSDDSNCSNQTTHSMVTSVASPPPSKNDVTAASSTTKFITTSIMAETMLQRLRQRLGFPIAGSGATTEAAMRSLELLRISVQNAFDKEIDEVVKRFIDSFFKPAFNNIKENLGRNAIAEETLQKMSCALLENSKAQYNTFRLKATNTTNAENSARLSVKRSAARSSICANETSKKMLMGAASSYQHLSRISISGDGTVRATQVQSETEQLMMQHKASIAPPARRQIFWNTALISTATKFVLDVQANQAFGFGTDGKERLASKHPELIRYLPDSEDRDWLISQNIISQLNRNSRFLFLIHEEVCRLQQTHENYRNKANINLNVMHTFNVPDFMIEKMKLFFVDLNIKSRGLITNSFSIDAVNHASNGNSHLRNALLQGVQQNSTVVETIASVCKAEVAPLGIETISPSVSSSSAAAIEIRTIVADEQIDIASGHLKPKASTLSSSHATLTALLNNSAGIFNVAANSSDKTV